MVNLFQVGNTQSQFSCRGDVVRLPIKQVLRCVLVKLRPILRQAIRIARPDGGRSFRASLGFNLLQFDGIHRDRIGPHEHHACLMDKVLILRQRASVPDHACSVHNMKHRLRAEGLH